MDFKGTWYFAKKLVLRKETLPIHTMPNRTPPLRTLHILFLIFAFGFTQGASAQTPVQNGLILNGDETINCFDGAPAPIGEECARTPLISSDWRMRLLREDGTGSVVLLDQEPPLNTSVDGVSTNAQGGHPGDATVVEVSKRSNSTGDNCFVLGDVWLHKRSPISDGTCRFRLHRRPQGDICGANPARFASNVAYFPTGCGENALRAEFLDLPTSLEVGERTNFTLDLVSGLGGDGYTSSGCYPARLPFYSMEKDRVLMTGFPVEESYPAPTGLPPSFLSCESEMFFRLGVVGGASLQYEVTPRERGTVVYRNSPRISTTFNLGDGSLQASSAHPAPYPITITGGLKLSAKAPEVVKPKKKTFTLTLGIQNQGKGKATVSGKACNLLIKNGYSLVTPTKNSGYESDFSLSSAERVEILCEYQVLGSGFVDFNLDTFWVHESGGEVLTRYRCDEQLHSDARCVPSSVTNEDTDLIRVAVSMEDGECGDGIIDPNEECDGGACCTQKCRFVPRGEPCLGESVCATGGGLCLGNASFCPGEKEDDRILSVDFSLHSPVGNSPKIFTDGWILSAEATARCSNGNSRDLSQSVTWSGSGSFSPSAGTRSRPTFPSTGSHEVTLSYDGDTHHERTFTVSTISPAGYAAVGDIAYCPHDAHGALSTDGPVEGPVTGGSPLITVYGRAAARVGDPGVHAACAGPNSFIIAAGDPEVLISGLPAARRGDETRHCGGYGTLRDVASTLSPRTLTGTRALTAFADGTSGTISGTVSFEEAPLQGAQVVLVSEAGKAYAAWSGEDGSFSFDPLPVGNYTQRCQMPGSGFVIERYTITDSQTLPSISLNPSQSLSGADCVLKKGGMISGIAFTDSGTPLEGVWVHAQPEDLSQEGGSAKTTSEGIFAIDGLAQGSYRLYAVSEPLGFQNRYAPSTLSYDHALSIPVIGSQQTRGISITFPSDISSLSCEFSDLNGTKLSGVTENQDALVQISRRALTLFRRSAKLKGGSAISLAKRQKKKLTRALRKTEEARDSLPSVIHSGCPSITGCTERSTDTVVATLAKSHTLLAKLSRKNLRGAKRASSRYAKKVKKLSKKLKSSLVATKAAVGALPSTYLECEE
jgi:uncharacterized Zn-binding protein involved in type VI secretion